MGNQEASHKKKVQRIKSSSLEKLTSVMFSHASLTMVVRERM
jgi:hypothetical protein